ncbi:MAG TPA: hypothetical protein VM285_05400, partial [Polyangia bacterium]|nr:hypothetical protein [Polyangia bacterium]
HPRLGDLSHPHLPLLPHPAAIELLASAAGALVLGNRNRAQLPSKAYEIACTETWALCVSELSDDPAAAVLERTGHAVRPAANEAEAIAAAAEEILAREARGERPSPAAEYSWERRIDEIAALVEGLGGHRAGPS